MTTEPPRRRVRRSAQSRPTARGAVPAAAPQPEPEALAPAPGDPVAVAPRPARPERPAAVDGADRAFTRSTAAHHPGPEAVVSEALDDAAIDRAGTWLPVGIVVLVMAYLLLCAALVLVASRQ